MFLILSWNSVLIVIDHPCPSLLTSMTLASRSESTCFLIAGKVRVNSLSSALIETPCLLKSRYLSMSTLALLQKSFSRFMIDKVIKAPPHRRNRDKIIRRLYHLVCFYIFGGKLQEQEKATQRWAAFYISFDYYLIILLTVTIKFINLI